MAVDLLLPYGGDVSFTNQGAPVLVTDVPGNAAATTQQVTALCMQTPRLYDANGVGIGRPDSKFYPDRGGGLRAIVGTNAQTKDIDAMRARLLKGLASSTAVASTPLPQVLIAKNGAALNVQVTCYTATGDIIQVAHVNS